MIKFIIDIQDEHMGMTTLEDYINASLDLKYSVTVKTALKIHLILNGCDKDYMIFDNAGGNIFEIWEDFEPILKDKKMYKHILAHRINGETKIWNLHWAVEKYLHDLSWKIWKAEFQKLIHKDSSKDESTKLFNNRYLVTYLEGMHNCGMSAKDGYEKYLDSYEKYLKDHDLKVVNICANRFIEEIEKSWESI